MSTPLALSQLNLIVKDVAASIAFYRRLGVSIEPAGRPEWAPHHASAVMPNGVRLELDSVRFAAEWNRGAKAHTPGTMGVLFFEVATREEVDRIFHELTAAGHPAQHAPEDAFWGARYAIVEDPDGNAVGVMSPSDPVRRRAPPPPPA